MAELSLALETELRSFREVLLRSIAEDVSAVFRNRMVKIAQCVEESVGGEMARLKKENERLKVRLRFWEKESGAGGDRGQTDRVGHTLPREAPAGIKEEMDVKLELSGSEASALPDAGDRAPLEQQHSEEEEEGISSLLQERELTTAQGKETLSEQQHPESRQRVEDLDSVPTMKTEPESLLVKPSNEMNDLDIKNISESCTEQDSVSVQEIKELGEFPLTEQYVVIQLTDPAEQQTAVPGEENSTESQHPEESQDREEQEQHLQGLIIMRPCSVQVERLSVQRCFKQSYDPSVSDDLTHRFNNLVTEKTVEDFNELESVSLGHREEQLNAFSLRELEKEPQMSQTSEQHTEGDDGENTPQSPHAEQDGVGISNTPQRVRTGERPFSCSQCGKSFSDSRKLKTHQRVHTGERPFSCSQCGKSFRDSSKLKTHQRVHTGEKPFSCSQCGKSFSVSGKLKTHQRVHTGEKPFSCHQCGKSFRDSSALRAHRRIHTGERPFSCRQCGKSFSQPGHLKAHQLIHTGEKLFCCSHCGKSFSDSSKLKIHQRVHTGERPFSCQQCGKRFSDSSALSAHQRTHTGEKPFSCRQCGKSFIQSGHLKAHQLIHTGEKLFSCGQCGKSFSDSSKLKTHQRVHTGEKPFSCSQCGKSFRYSSNLRAHQRVHPGETIQL